MPQYIDKESVITEIKKKRDDYINSCMSVQAHVLSDVLDFLDTLEVKEEVLDRNDKTKLMQKCVKAAYKRGYDMGVLQTTNKVNHNTKDLEKENLPISNSLTKEGLVIFEDGSQAIITKIN